MNELQIFENATFGNVRTLLKDGVVWFVANDVCKCLELDNSTKALSTLEIEDKSTLSAKLTNSKSFSNFNDLQKDSRVITESGVYELVFKSRKKEAREFKKWVIREVIPTISRTGSYNAKPVLPDFTNPAESARAWALEFEQKQKALEENQALLLKIEADAPKNFFAEVVTNSKDCILVRDLAKLINQSLNISIGEKRLYAMLRVLGYIEKYGRKPLQKSIDLKIMIVTESTRTNSSEGSKLEFTTKITGKGQIYFIDKFKTMQENGKLEILQEQIKEKVEA